ncbi:Nitroreductase family protein [Micromonospora phaseoli]|uniref:Nitroreductase family protein n=1 Tax=Micromonospora phaseoli TaxID=1144548 RepID=A0A1H7DDU3_9ACTN|nr:nitroreductase family protein [Micromonospora phaseoli]PZV90514.1 nitroreductase family protein [Micromonospora phaseoli]GIJ78094.1 nitroreductase [Micromonospora phaseoli]SEJ99971.1 Nitroreductase family protein [Micromonospora phaseoli]
MTDLTPLLAFRWSPRSFDPVAELTHAETATLLEAARWAPSVGNRQPWRFAVGHREDETFKRILVNLPPADQRWAGRASVLLLAAYRHAGNPFATYDLGQAVAHLTVQATALGLHVRQVTDLDRAGLVADLDLPRDVRPCVVVTVGQLGDPFSLPADLLADETSLRHRRPLAELVMSWADSAV